MRIVPDTNILVRAAAKGKGPARELLQLIVDSPQHILILSPFLLKELERVFSYDRVRAATKLTDEETAEYLAYLRAPTVSEVVFPGRLRAWSLPIPTTIQWFTPQWSAVPMRSAP